MTFALPTTKLFLSRGMYDALCDDYNDIRTYVARAHGRVLVKEEQIAEDTIELTLAGLDPPLIVNGHFRKGGFRAAG